MDPLSPWKLHIAGVAFTVAHGNDEKWEQYCLAGLSHHVIGPSARWIHSTRNRLGSGNKLQERAGTRQRTCIGLICI
ncbi:uncharacterized protein BO72DRAFT_451561 [Aspergillus fijiensis CBS 313.89]|uniref:Uncharacterized protein n=1 Tax=Aspergillus fijiensis CBS 313.89 TaxID=1448319 RepID=A0A8G1VVV2_9EURO|nr:uncharacterized protein BO72DRAFT_451561 [Aspergillus fijiensis CBS 313.89]RAK73561.1 hypothetical protein BO72DRAFT_451561 [Aspergillus fijiensis CBS 313.89]